MCLYKLIYNILKIESIKFLLADIVMNAVYKELIVQIINIIETSSCSMLNNITGVLQLK